MALLDLKRYSKFGNDEELKVLYGYAESVVELARTVSKLEQKHARSNSAIRGSYRQENARSLRQSEVRFEKALGEFTDYGIKLQEEKVDDFMLLSIVFMNT